MKRSGGGVFGRLALHVGILRSLLFLTGCASLAAYADAEEPKKANGDCLAIKRKVEELVEALVNHNPTPKMVKVFTSFDASLNPLFSDDYNWKEDGRVREVAKEFEQYRSETLWWVLMEHRNDDRYVLSFAHNDGARIASIGCLARSEVVGVLTAPYVSAAIDIDDDDSARTVYRAVRMDAFDNCLDTWYQTHKDVPLYQQQIEMCEIALEKAQSSRNIPDTKKRKFVAEVTKRIKGLREKREPVLGKSVDLIWRESDFYDAKQAKEIKEKYLRAGNKKRAN